MGHPGRNELQSKPMAKLTVDLSESLNRFKCEHCGEDSITVWGFIAKDGCAHAVYYANMVKEHPELEVRLTVSIGNWGEDGPVHRAWVFMEVRPQGESWAVRVGDSGQSFYKNSQILGRAMDREEALKSPLLPEFFAVADFVMVNDPAVNSFLRGESVDTSGREPVPH